MGEQKEPQEVKPNFILLWQVLGVVGLLAGIGLWAYAYFTPEPQYSAVSVGSALFSSGVVLLVGATLGTRLSRR